MRILILWRRGSKEMRNTIADHAFSFCKYDLENEYFYFDVYNGRFPSDYEWITENMFDAVIFHYTALAMRWTGRWGKDYWPPFLKLMSSLWKRYPCVKVLLPQDDYDRTQAVWDMAKGIGADYIYTVIRPEDYEILYPKEKIGKCEVNTVLTGYVDEKYITEYDRHNKRIYDIVYRARQLPYCFGKHGQLKTDIVELFEKRLRSGQGENLRYDLGNTKDNQGAFLGDEWINFLASSRTTIGCLGGSGFADMDGHIWKGFAEYLKYNPDADYDTAKQACFPDMEENLHGVASPRIFESALTKTCQILVGRDYQGILKPDVDYIVLNEDYSNLDDVMQQIKDVRYCEQIAEQCYRDIVESSKYSYAIFANEIVKGISDKVDEKKPKDSRLSQIIRESCDKNNQQVYREMGIL